MPLIQYTQAELVQAQITDMQARARAPQDFSVGSINLALIESNASIGIGFQAQSVFILSLTRAGTSTGADLDSFMADYGLTRLKSVPSSGFLSFGRFTPTLQAVINVGTLVQTQNGNLTFSVEADTINPYYNSGQNAYIIPSNIEDIEVPVICSTAGSAGNVLANTITSLITPISGIDTVTNPNSFTNGLDQESDSAFRQRFIYYINGLSKANIAAVNFAVASLQSNIRFNVVENQSTNFTPQPGFFFVVVDDGSGMPSADLVSRANAAIQEVRGTSILCTAIPPTVLQIDISAVVKINPNGDAVTIKKLIEDAIRLYIFSLPLGGTLPYTRIADVIYNASNFIVNVTNIQSNGGISDIIGSPKNAFVPDNISISVTL